MTGESILAALFLMLIVFGILALLTIIVGIPIILYVLWQSSKHSRGN